MEVFGLGDNYNARNLANSSLETERIGLPSLNLLYEFDESFFQLVLIYETLPSHFPQGRNRSGLELDLEAPRFLTDDKTTGERELTEFIFRYKRFFEDFEFDFHYSQKYDTAYPLITIDKPKQISPTVDDLEIRPYYQPVRQTYLSLQSEQFEALWKFEFINVDFQGYSAEFFFLPSTLIEVEQIDFNKVSMGYEKAHDYENNHSATFLVEYTSVLGVTYDEARSLGAFQRDMMLGYRHSFNDFKAHEIQVATIIDLQTYDEFVYTLKHSMRLNNYWTLESQATVIDTPMPDDNEFAENYYGLKPLRESDNILVNLIRYF